MTKRERVLHQWVWVIPWYSTSCKLFLSVLHCLFIPSLSLFLSHSLHDKHLTPHYTSHSLLNPPFTAHNSHHHHHHLLPPTSSLRQFNLVFDPLLFIDLSCMALKSNSISLNVLSFTISRQCLIHRFFHLLPPHLFWSKTSLFFDRLFPLLLLSLSFLSYFSSFFTFFNIFAFPSLLLSLAINLSACLSCPSSPLPPPFAATAPFLHPSFLLLLFPSSSLSFFVSDFVPRLFYFILLSSPFKTLLYFIGLSIFWSHWWLYCPYRDNVPANVWDRLGQVLW